MKHHPRLLALLLSAAQTAASVSGALPEDPDFAFPQKVLKDAEAVYRRATGLERMQAAMQIAKAQCDVDPDSAFTMPAFIAATAEKEESAAVRGLLTLYEARMLADIYNGSKYKYDRVTAPAEPLPDDIAEWSGGQFRTQIATLTDLALMLMQGSFASPLSDYRLVISDVEAARQYYPTLLDLAALAGSKLYAAAEYYDKANNLKEKALKAAPDNSLRRAAWLVNIGNPEQMWQAYLENPRGEAAAVILYSLRDCGNYDVVTALRKYLADNPENEFTPALKSRYLALTNPEASFEAPSLATPGRGFKIEIDRKYTASVGIKVYRIQNPESAESAWKLKSVGEYTVMTDSLTCGMADIELMLDNAGWYRLVPCVNGRENSDRWNNLTVQVTPYIPFTFGKEERNVAILTDYADGAPVASATIDARKSGGTVNLGATDSEGILRFDFPKTLSHNHAYPLSATVQGRQYYFGQNFCLRYSHDYVQPENVRIEMFTDRPIYRPRDTMEWALVAVKIDPSKKTTALVKSQEVKVALYDANYNKVDTATVTTDAFGRANGSFIVPTDRLTGHYTLRAEAGRSSYDSKSVMVSDFKAPVFELVDVKAVRQTDGSVAVTGTARTYAGMPVADAKVEVKVSELPRWRWFFFRPAEVNEADASGTSDSAGNFSVLIAADKLQTGTDYSASVFVTSAAAETASGSVFFTTGKPYSLQMGSDRPYCVDGPVSLPVTVFGPDGTPADLDVDWSLENATDTVAGQGTVTPEGLTIDIPDAPAGVYTLTVRPKDPAAADSIVAGDVVLYSESRNAVPAATPILLPSESATVESDDTAAVTVGVPRHTYLYILSRNVESSDMPEITLRELQPGFHRLEVAIPHQARKASVELLTVCDGELIHRTIGVSRPDRGKVTLKAESMRDKLVPGSRETWKFTLTTANGKPVGGAMIATLYNHALDALGATLGWPAALPRFSAYTSLPISTLDNWERSARMTLRNDRPWAYIDIAEPAFRYNTEYFTATIDYAMPMRTAPMMSKMAANLRATADMDEEVDAEYETAEAAPTAGATSGEGSDESAGGNGDVRLRPGEVLQAFWLPDISVNDRGEAEITFTVPEAIGSWRFNALAWDNTVHSSLLTADIISSKPLMVQPNAPRFLRNGDRARLITTVYNNSDRALTAHVTAEFFKIATGEILASESVDLDIEPSASAQAKVWVNVPADLSVLGYRVKAAAADYTDGEQTAIPVLSSGTTVVDTQNFVLSAENPTATLTVPENSSTIALQYCQNPVWDAVRALPDLLAKVEAKTSPQAAQLLYGAMTAAGMTERFPEIPRVLKAWKENPADSALVSDLLKNEDIKLALLAQTPWVNAAAGQTERMSRLSAVFDPVQSRASLEKALTALDKLRCSGGGFAWGDWDKTPSLWATYEVAWAIGHINLEGFLDKDSRAANLALDALRYIDGKMDQKDDGLSYIELLAFYPGYNPTTHNAVRAADRAVQYILKNWKHASTARKARYALALDSRGYNAVAKEIMQSVRQFAVTDRYGATSFPSVSSVYDYAFILDAFAKIDDPDTELIDGIRRSVLLRTQATDDLGTIYPAPVISALLRAGSQWTAINPDASPAISIDNTPLSLDQIEYATGAISRRLPLTDSGKSLTVTRDGGDSGISYGSLTSISTQQSRNVAAAACPQLSIEKTLLVKRGDKWLAAERIALGDRVRVRLTVKASADLEYVTVNDERAAALEPVDQLPGYVYAASVAFYRENSDSRTRMFIGWLPKGTYSLEYDLTAAAAGEYSSGIATAQSQYAPEIVAHSAGATLSVE